MEHNTEIMHVSVTQNDKPHSATLETRLASSSDHRGLEVELCSDITALQTQRRPWDDDEVTVPSQAHYSNDAGSKAGSGGKKDSTLPEL